MNAAGSPQAIPAPFLPRDASGLQRPPGAPVARCCQVPDAAAAAQYPAAASVSDGTAALVPDYKATEQATASRQEGTAP